MPPQTPLVIAAPLEKLQRHRDLRTALAERQANIDARYVHDPVLWARDRLGVHLWSRQRDIAQSVVDNRFTAVQSAAGVGKTYLAAILALWFGTVHALSDVKIVTTAPTSDQVTLLLWGEIRRHHAASDLPGRMLFNDRWVAGDGYVAAYGRKPPDHSQSAFQGAHAGKMLVIVDEAGGIDAPLWAAIRAITTNRDASVLAIGNPDRSASEFARMCQPGTSWTPFKISVFDTPRFTGEQVPEHLLTHLPSPEFVDSCRIDWGESSTLYKAKVLGEFSDDADGLIPYSWVVAAQERWRNYWTTLATGVEPPGRPLWSCDVATTGDDQTVIVRKQGPVLYSLERWAFNEDPIEVAELVRTRVQSVPQSRAVIDSNGEGKGTFAALRRQGVPVTAYIGSKATNRVDSTGTARFERVRSAAWWAMREALNPALGATLCLPPDDKLARDLTTPHYQVAVSGKIQVEPREDTRRRLGRSTDSGDACLVAGTSITTPRGPVAIKDIRPGDRVLTRVGWCAVEACGQTAEDAALVCATLADGRELTGTANHPVWDGYQFRPLGEFCDADSMAVCLPSSVSSTSGTSSRATRDQASGTCASTSGRAKQRATKASERCTSRSTGMRTATFLMVGTCTTSTTTLWTTPRTIWSACRRLITRDTTPKTGGAGKTPSTWGAFANWPSCGTPRPMAALGTPSTASARGKTGSGCPARLASDAADPPGRSWVSTPTAEIGAVDNAACDTHTSIASTGTTPPARSAGQDSSRRPVESPALALVPVARTCAAGTGPVWNLQVAGQPEYIANGVLVHNCVMAVWTDGAPELDDIPGERARQRPRARQYAASQF